MAKASLEFDLNEPDDFREFTLASRAKNLYLSLWAMDSYLRDQIKYHDKLEFQPVRSKLHELLRINDIDLDSLA